MKYLNLKTNYVKNIKYHLPNCNILMVGVHDFKYINGIFKKRSHPFYTLHYVIDGLGYYSLKDSKEYPISKGQIFMTPPNTELSYYPDKKSPWKYLWFDIYNDREASKLYNLFFKVGEVPILKILNNKSIESLINDLHNHEKSDILFSVDVNNLLNTLIKVVVKDREKESIRKKSLVEQVIELIENNYFDQDFNVSKINEIVNSSNLSYIFKKETGQSILSYLIDYRLNKARELFNSKDLTIREILFMVGYSDESHFSKSFKNKYQLSPSIYRKKQEQRYKNE